MSSKFGQYLRSALVFLNPYYNRQGRFEFSRVVAVSLFSMVCLPLYLFRQEIENYKSLEAPYNLAAEFYYYVMIVPTATVPTAWAWIKEQPAVSTNEVVNSIVTYGGLTLYIVFGLSLYMAIYCMVQRLTKSPFRIGDFLGFYGTPLFLAGFWYCSLMGIHWLIN